MAAGSAGAKASLADASIDSNMTASTEDISAAGVTSSEAIVTGADTASDSDNSTGSTPAAPGGDLDLDVRLHLKGHLVEFEELCVGDSRYVPVLFEIGDGVSQIIELAKLRHLVNVVVDHDVRHGTLSPGQTGRTLPRRPPTAIT